VKINYVRSGSEGKQAVLLIHGWPETSYAWHKVAPLLSEHTLIMPDLRGLGDSSVPADGYDKKTIAGDLVRLVVDILKLDRIFVVGHDWGGVVAFFTAAGLGTKCLGLAVLDVTIPGSPSINFSQDGKRWHHRFNQQPNLPEALVTGREDAYFNYFFDNYGSKPGVIDPDAINEYMRTYSDSSRLPASFAYYRNIPKDIEDARSIRLSVPVLALGGADSYGRGEEPVASLKDFAADVQGGSIANCGHWLPEEQPVEVAERLKSFFAYCLKPVKNA
jgi:pimeloyl-ACP methyl ester carboxylesterase